MMKILNIGMNHETAPVELRECLVSDPHAAPAALVELMQSDYIKEGLFISTCNRVEMVVTTEHPKEARDSILSLISRLGNLQTDQFARHLYTFEDNEAVGHIFKVASSLDSLVVGEAQILGQIKLAYAEAVKHKASGVILNRLMHRAFHVAKRVRTETGICESAVSISYAAVELAKKIFHILDGKKVLLIGAGEMAELAARHLLTHGVCSLIVANRTFERAVQVAEVFKGRPVSFEEISSQLLEADIVLTSTASREYVITSDQVRSCLRKRRNRPLFFIDIAVPRNVDPDVNELSNVYLYDIDDLKGVIRINTDQRRQEAFKAERIVSEEVIKFEKWMKTLEVVPTIVSLSEKAEAIVRSELKKSDSVLSKLTSDQREAVHTLTRSIVDKVLNDPILFLKRKADRPAVNTYIDLARKLFNLDQEADSAPLSDEPSENTLDTVEAISCGGNMVGRKKG